MKTRPLWWWPSARRGSIRRSRPTCSPSARLAVVHKVVRMPNQSLFVFAEGLERVKVTEYTQLHAVHARHGGDHPRDHRLPRIRADRSAAAQRADAVPADRRRLADLVGRAVHRRRQHRRCRPHGRLHRLVAAVALDPRQAGRAGDARRSASAWRRSTSTWPRSWKFSNCATRFRAKCRTGCSRRSASTTCASR